MPPQYYDDLGDYDDFEDEDYDEDGEQAAGDGPTCTECSAPVQSEGQLCAQCTRWADGSNRWPR